MNTQGVGIRPNEGGFATPGRPIVSSDPLHTQGQGDGGSPGQGIRLQRRVLEHPGPLATAPSGTREGARNLPTDNTAGR